MINRAIEVREFLKEEFPLAFKDHNNVQPLKHDIYTDLLQYFSQQPITTFSSADLLIALKLYQNSTNYLRNHWPYVARLNLMGKSSGIVTLQEAIQAQKLIAKRCPHHQKMSKAEFMLRRILLSKVTAF